MSKRQAALRKKKKFPFDKLIAYLSEDAAPIITKIYYLWEITPKNNDQGRYRRWSSNHRLHLSLDRYPLFTLYFRKDVLELRVRVADLWQHYNYFTRRPARLLMGTILLTGDEIRNTPLNVFNRWIEMSEKYCRDQDCEMIDEFAENIYISETQYIP